MLSIAALKAATSLSELADLLGFTPKAVSYLVYKFPKDSKYRSFSIAKRGGGERHILAPNDQLMLLQRRLSDLLQDCYEEICTAEGWHDQAAHGFKRKRSIVTNARKHRAKRFVFNIDLENFFDTINFGRVRGFLIKNKYFALDPAVATVISQIACHENKLPQGSPCSPVISNLVAQILDNSLRRAAAKYGCTYSRYADDISLSTNKRTFPSEIALLRAGAPNTWIPGDSIERAIAHSGFKINPQKTRMQFSDSRQEVTGLVVNSKLNTRMEYRHKVRAMADRLFRTGSFSFFHGTPNCGTLSQLHGSLGFIDGVDLYNKSLERRAGVRTRQKGDLSARESLYKRFLLFRFFYVASQPVILCEGKTDNVYLRLAIKSLASSFPKLIDAVGKLSVNLFKYKQTSTGRILNLSGGSGELADFIRAYCKEVKRYKAKGQTHPVILLADNDDGKKTLCNVAKETCGTKPSGAELFTNIAANLYLVLTPPTASGGSSVIEDLFPAAVTSTTLAGKTFSRQADFDPTLHFGKHVFSQKIVAANAATIDFSGFNLLLTRIDAAIADHYMKTTKVTP